MLCTAYRRASRRHYYEGGFAFGNFSGHATYCFANGASFTGEWCVSQRHGTGTQTEPDGRVYEGRWLMGKKHGAGVYSWPGGARYEGEWALDQRHGRGRQVEADGTIFEGEWVDGKYAGEVVPGEPTLFPDPAEARGSGVGRASDGDRDKSGVTGDSGAH